MKEEGGGASALTQNGAVWCIKPNGVVSIICLRNYHKTVLFIGIKVKKYIYWSVHQFEHGSNWNETDWHPFLYI